MMVFRPNFNVRPHRLHGARLAWQGRRERRLAMGVSDGVAVLFAQEALLQPQQPRR